MKTFLIAGFACVAAVALSACSTLGGLPSASPAAQTAFIDNLNNLNAAAAKNCTGGGDFSWNPPLPPTGNLHLHCDIGQASAAALPPALLSALAQAGFVPAKPADAAKP